MSDPGPTSRGSDGGDPLTPGTALDPGRLGVMQSSFDFICAEMGRSLQRTAFSPNIKERLDASCALFDIRMQMFAQAEHIPIHLGSMPLALELMLGEGGEFSPGELREGDQLMTNDPFLGGSHLPDITLVRPVFTGVELMGYCVNRAHHSDVGGCAMGSLPPGSTTLEDEGVLIPPTLVVRGGTIDREALSGILSATVTSHEREGDLMAQIGANELGARWFSKYGLKFGEAAFVSYVGAIMENARVRMAQCIGAIPDGTYNAVEYLELPMNGGEAPLACKTKVPAPVTCDGEPLSLEIDRILREYWDLAGAAPVGDEPSQADVGELAAIEVSIGIDGGEAVLDFTGTAPQADCNLNAPLSVVMSVVNYAFRSLMDPSLPINAGSLRQMKVVAPKGCLLNPRRGAAVAAGNVETSQRVVDVIFRALAPALPLVVPAQAQGTMNNLIIGGHRPGADAQRPGRFTYYETIGGGEGAYPWRPGQSGVQVHMTNTRNTPVEAVETAYPLMVLEHSLRPGSGGPGRHGGGSGIRKSILYMGEQGEASLVASRRRTRPEGLNGGEPGLPGLDVLIRDGETHTLPGQIRVTLRHGDIISIHTPGGGGWGRAPK